MLTAQGRALASKIGEAFALHGIKPKLVSSPMCRCRDTAQIAFGQAPLMLPVLREITTADSARVAEFEQTAQRLIAQHRGASPLVFVSHRPNIDRLSLELIEEGEMLVAKANSQGELTVLGKIVVGP
jgi:phosphohistidine phosphatase SixA